MATEGVTNVLSLAQFTLHRRAFRDSLTDPKECLFAPAIAVSFGMILITIIEYGSEHTGSWFPRAILYMFWINAAFSVLLSISIYLNLWSTQSFAIEEMTPIWLFPAYPLLLLGPLATVFQVIIGGVTIQGIGFILSLTIYSTFIYRLMTLKLPSEDLRPGMFVP
ncbi:hypothetical protein BOTCAL_0075g00200 [Botryotinia calthae]|uniref:Malic acid transport protein n=1 Tax=Botryotinia calthae TaxID=38488 RepID=A0A4Y8DAS4_9HELO|nr:hypothetical protein BOTCAL_0075g00200 [Botryotinia calthae]